VAAARGKLVAAVQKKADGARNKGDLVELQQLEGQIRALESEGKLPTAVPTQSYDSDVRKARSKMEDAYEAAVQQYTKNGAREPAVAALAQLDEFELAGVKSGYDPFLPGATFIARSATGEVNAELTVQSRKASSIKLAYSGPTSSVAISAKLEGAVIRWDITDAKAERGYPFSGSVELAPGHGHYKFTYKGQSGKTGTRDFVRKGL